MGLEKDTLLDGRSHICQVQKNKWLYLHEVSEMHGFIREVKYYKISGAWEEEAIELLLYGCRVSA